MSELLEVAPGHLLDVELSGASGGTPVVFLNGSVFNHRQWQAIVRGGVGLTGRYRIVRYDYGGIGRSVTPVAQWDLQALVAELGLLLDRLSIDRVHLYGISKGTMVAQLFALGYPERVASLSGYGWYHFGYTDLPALIPIFARRLRAFRKLEPIWDEPLTQAHYLRLWEEVYRFLIFQKSPERFSFSERIAEFVLRRKLFPLLAPTPIRRMHDWFAYAVEVLPTMQRLDLAPLARVPMLIQHATADATLPVAMSRELHAALPHAELREYGPGFTHISLALQRAQARVVMGEYLQFLDRTVVQ